MSDKMDFFFEFDNTYFFQFSWFFCNWSSAASALAFTCGYDNLKKIVMYPSHIMTEKKIKWPIHCNFSHFTSIIWPCGRDNMKSFPLSCSNLLCMLLIRCSWTSSITGEKNSKWSIYCDFSARLLILFKKYGLLQLKFGVVGVGVSVNIYLWAR